jgi:hypothetical protein
MSGHDWRVPATTDPDRPGRLLGEAERAAAAINDEGWRASRLSQVARALAAIAPDRAILLAGILPRYLFDLLR